MGEGINKMAIGPIENATIARLQDYTTVKQQEDQRAMLTQEHLGAQTQKNVEEKSFTVQKNENASLQNQRQDPREKGKNAYAGDGGSQRKKAPVQERVVKKTNGSSFDIKI